MVCAAIISCNKDAEYKVKITAYNGNFKGAYTVDGKSTVEFVGIVNTSSIYSYDKRIDMQDNIIIDITPDPDLTTSESNDTLVTNISCRIYLDDELVHNMSQNVTSTALITCEYKTSESNTSTETQ